MRLSPSSRSSLASLALLILLFTGCGGGGGGSSTATDQPQSASGERTASTGSAAQGAAIRAVPDAVPRSGFSEKQRERLEERGFSRQQIEGLEAHARKLGTEKGRPRKPPLTHHDAPSGAASFETKGGDNSIQQFGSESGSSEFDQAAAALHGYLDARAAGDWPAACSNLAAGISSQLTQLAAGRGGEEDCPKLLASITAASPPALRRQTAEADVAAFRVDGERGFLLYHGIDGVDYFIPMTREADQWKVAAIAPSALG